MTLNAEKPTRRMEFPRPGYSLTGKQVMSEDELIEGQRDDNDRQKGVEVRTTNSTRGRRRTLGKVARWR